MEILVQYCYLSHRPSGLRGLWFPCLPGPLQSTSALVLSCPCRLMCLRTVIDTHRSLSHSEAGQKAFFCISLFSPKSKLPRAGTKKYRNHCYCAGSDVWAQPHCRLMLQRKKSGKSQSQLSLLCQKSRACWGSGQCG